MCVKGTDRTINLNIHLLMLGGNPLKHRKALPPSGIETQDVIAVRRQCKPQSHHAGEHTHTEQGNQTHAWSLWQPSLNTPLNEQEKIGGEVLGGIRRR